MNASQNRPTIFAALSMLILFSESTLVLAKSDSVLIDKVQNWYYNGHFGEIIQALEEYKRSGQMKTRDDSIFVYKYLGVIYGADSDEQKKGEAYLYSFLRLEPQSDLDDMHLSGPIQDLFDKVRQRFKNDFPEIFAEPKLEKEEKSISIDSVAQAAYVSGAVEAEKDMEKKRWIWVATGGAATAGVLTAILLVSRNKKNNPEQSVPVLVVGPE